MLAARIHEWGGEPVVDDVPEPQAGPGERLVEIEAAAVAHIDATIASGTFPLRPELPYTGGMEGAGRLVETGERVRFRGVLGAWAERVAVPAAALVPVPEGVALELAATFFSPCTTAHVALYDVGALQPGERVGVRGARGAVGSLTVQLAVRAGAEVVATARTEEKAAAIPTGAVRLVGDEGIENVDLLVDMVGGEDLGALVMRAVRPGGRVALVGYASGTHATFDLPNLLARDVRLLPVNMMRRQESVRARAAELLEELRTGELHLDVTTFPFEHAAEAMRALLESRVQGKVALLVRA